MLYKDIPSETFRKNIFLVKEWIKMQDLVYNLWNLIGYLSFVGFLVTQKEIVRNLIWRME